MIIKKGFLLAVIVLLSSATYCQFEDIRDKFDSMPKTEESVIWLCDTAYAIHNNQPAISEQVALHALKKAKEWQLDKGLAKASHVLGISHWARDNYSESIEYYIQALGHYEKLGDSRGMALISMNIGSVYDDLNQPERGKPYLLKSSKVIREVGDSTNLARVLNNLAVVYKKIDLLDSSLYYYDQTLVIKKALYDSIGVARVYSNIAALFNEGDGDMKDYTLARENLLAAYNYIRPGDDNRLYARIHSNMAHSLLFLNRYAEAEEYLIKALAIAQEHGFKLIEQGVYMNYVKLFKRMNDFEKALSYHTKVVELNEEIRGASISKQIDDLNIKYETAKKERQLAELERQKVVDRETRNVLLGTILDISILAVAIILYIYKKRQKDRVIAQLRMEKLAEMVNSKNKEIASYTMSFLQKNQLMEELKEQINQLKKSSDISTNKELTRINRIVDNTFRSDEEWKTFQITFDQMHDGFFKDLKNAFPEISNAELKLCALLRLNMNLKESAKILGIAADSVKTARYRLRKKLGLKTEDNLVDFLIRFEKPRLTG